MLSTAMFSMGDSSEGKDKRYFLIELGAVEGHSTTHQRISRRRRLRIGRSRRADQLWHVPHNFHRLVITTSRYSLGTIIVSSRERLYLFTRSLKS